MQSSAEHSRAWDRRFSKDENLTMSGRRSRLQGERPSKIPPGTGDFQTMTTSPCQARDPGYKWRGAGRRLQAKSLQPTNCHSPATMVFTLPPRATSALLGGHSAESEWADLVAGSENRLSLDIESSFGEAGVDCETCMGRASSDQVRSCELPGCLGLPLLADQGQRPVLEK